MDEKTTERLRMDFAMMASFRCEHVKIVHHPGTKIASLEGLSCERAGAERGGVCNGCWARRCADKWLRELGAPAPTGLSV